MTKAHRELTKMRQNDRFVQTPYECTFNGKSAPALNNEYVYLSARTHTHISHSHSNIHELLQYDNNRLLHKIHQASMNCRIFTFFPQTIQLFYNSFAPGKEERTKKNNTITTDIVI